MSELLHPMETRRRSRSKTPFLRSACDHEHCEHAGEEGHIHHFKKKSMTSPKVQTIIEEREVVGSTRTSSEQTSLRGTNAESVQRKTKTSDYYSEESPENKSQNVNSGGTSGKGDANIIRTTTTTVTTKTSKGPVTRNSVKSTVLSSTPKSVFTDGAQKEISQNVINTEKEKHSLSASFSKFFTRSFNSSMSENGDVSDHLAYLEYKQAGEYWNKTPKTDYTYSELSSCRRQLAPGIIAMPNMSRRGLENHSERVQYMIQQNPEQADFIRRRYDNDYMQNRRQINRLTYDSGDETDMSQFTRKNYIQMESVQKSWLLRIFTTIITTISSVWTKVVVGSDANRSFNNSKLYKTRVAETHRGFIGGLADNIFRMLVSVYRYLYMFVARVLYWDTAILQSSHPNSKAKKRFLLTLLVLLPFLLAIAWTLLEDDERIRFFETSTSFLPLSLLSSFKGSFLAGGDYIRSFWQFPFAATNKEAPVPPVKIMNNLQENLQKALSPEEYDNLLNHINSYVQHLVEFQVKEQHKKLQEDHQLQARSLSSDQINIIANIMRENLQTFAENQKNLGVKLGDLSESDTLKLVGIIKSHLLSFEWPQKPMKLTKENLDEIKAIISQHIEINKGKSSQFGIGDIELEALLKRLLGSPSLADVINAQIQLSLKDKVLVDLDSMDSKLLEKRRLEELKNEIAFIKVSLSDKLSENADLQQSIMNLNVKQESLLQRLDDFETVIDKRFEILLGELEKNFMSLKDEHFSLLNKQVKSILVELLGFKSSSANVDVNDEDLRNWMHNIFVAKDYLEERLLSLNNSTMGRVRGEIDRSAIILMRDISERLKKEVLERIEAKYNESSSQLKGEIRAALSEEEVRSIVKSVLAIYDADKTGLVDFALESAGGSVLSTRCTENYQAKSAQISIFGIPLWYPTNTPRVAISPNVQPGECWAFQGFPGFLILKLNSLVHVTGFTLEHIPKSLSPNGRIDSAPKTFTVWGLTHEKDHDPVLFGEYEYIDNGASLQYFPVQNKEIKTPYNIVELRVESNHGHPQYTCLYRFRVHGKPPAA